MAYTTINKSSDYFNTKLTTGTGNSQAVTGLGFQPDWIWGKRRDSTGHHSLFDAVRGITKGLETNQTGVEWTSTGYYSSFDSDGFTISAGAGGAGNGSSQTAVQWCWKANGAGSSNTDGSITATVSANTTAGFSIIDFTGNETNSTVGHGLGVEPSMFIMKRYTDDGYSTSTAWYTYHKSLASNKYLELQSTGAVGTNDGSLWNTSTPVTSSVINIGFNANSNHTGNKTIIYAFAEKTGYSKFGSYLGNGNADGPFIFTGFKPSFYLWKRTDVTSNWFIVDNKRDAFNETDAGLFPDSSAAESIGNGYNGVDFLSNGVKVRQGNSDINNSSGTYIYMAFAEAPLVGSNGVTAKAR